MSPCHFPTQSSHSTGLVIVKVKFTVLRIETSEDIQVVFKVGRKLDVKCCLTLQARQM